MNEGSPPPPGAAVAAGPVLAPGNGSPVAVVRPRERHRRCGVRFSLLPEFEADPVAWVWNRHDPDHARDLKWLDARAPGWSTEIVRGGVTQVDLPVGAEPSAPFLGLEVFLVFAAVEHRSAWRRRVARQRQQHEHRRLKAEMRRKLAQPGQSACGNCGCIMVPFSGKQTQRIAQFAFIHTVEGNRCPECGCKEYSAAGLDDHVDACELAVLRVGLPDHGHPLWTEAIGEEWKRRRSAPPVVSIEILPEMTATDIVSRLDCALGRPPPGSKPRLVSG